MKTKGSLYILVLIATLFLTSCSKDSGEEDRSTGTETVEQPKVEGVVVKTEKEIQEDLDTPDFYTIFDNYCLDENGNFVGTSFSFEEVEITRRKVDEEAKSDDVYATISLKNDTCKYIGDFHLSYELYDVGGWYLDNIEKESGEYYPFASVPDQDPIDRVMEILGDLGATEENLSISRTNASPSIETVVVDVDYSDPGVSVNGTVTFSYYEDGNGWYLGDVNTSLAFNPVAGTYRSEDFYDDPAYIVINYEDGVPAMYLAYATHSTVLYPSKLNGEFDISTRRSGSYYIGPDGKIYVYDSKNGSLLGIFEWVTDPLLTLGELKELHANFNDLYGANAKADSFYGEDNPTIVTDVGGKQWIVDSVEGDAYMTPDGYVISDPTDDNGNLRDDLVHVRALE